eukprot:2111493-Prymnesium_polylepis.1
MLARLAPYEPERRIPHCPSCPSPARPIAPKRSCRSAGPNRRRAARARTSPPTAARTRGGTIS